MTNPTRYAVPPANEGSHMDPFFHVPGVLYCVVDLRGTILQTSGSWQAVLGYSSDELRLRTFFELLDPGARPSPWGDDPWTDRPGLPSEFVGHCLHKDGGRRTVRWRTQHRADLNATYAIGVEEPNDAGAGKLRGSSDQILFEANPNSMWVYDRETLRFLDVNDAAIEHYGYSRAEFLTMTLLDIRPTTDHEAVRDSVRRAPASGLTEIWTHITKGGSLMQVEVMVRDLEYHGRRARLASIKDVTEQLRAKALLQLDNELLEKRVAERTKQLTAANRELEAFCFSVSHDLRAPLRSIDGFSHSVLKNYGKALGPDGRSDLERVRRASKKMSELIDGLLGLARLTRQELRRQPVDLSEMAAQIDEEFRSEHPERKVTCIIEPGLRAVADPRLMHVVLHNLLSNAWKFTSHQNEAEIVFAAHQEGVDTVYSITDNGAGFDMAYLDKLFEPFQRLHHDSEFPGNGVGLATVKRIVTRHGGRAFAHGSVENGATISFTLSSAA